ncbi:hypothetical protein [Alloalcanivorax marinus]|uniref:hypothetical protein n=1 Tax=Alloalcanivorax marinus TaxID=1177169 RepID=UPI0019335C7E|nr:hypothetical protein [Alloalcanivorax marinus]MBL7252192.1 hypothetical protein [Alloalcanivorax marinus]
MSMWRFVVVMLLTWSSSAMASSFTVSAAPAPDSKPVESFRVSKDCLDSVKAGTEDQTGMPVVYIRLDEDGGVMLHGFTVSRVGHKMRLEDGDGEPLMATEPVIQSPLNRSLMLTGFESHLEAKEAAERVKNSEGECGPPR